MNTCPSFENWIVSFWGFCTSESYSESWPPRRELGNKLPLQLRGERGKSRHALLEGCTHCCICCMGTYSCYRTRSCHGDQYALLDCLYLQQFKLKVPCASSDSHNGSISLSPPIPVFSCFRLHCGGKQHKQTAVFSWAKGKLVREVKVNNIPCSLQWARDC